ncbi:phosphate-binding protein [Bacteroidia bacterium]|nr:phosphate-binding protein [Bacteroidia bacterium]
MKKISLILCMAVALASCGSPKKDGSMNISGAGATFPAPFYNVVCKEFSTATGNSVTYGGIGSGGGIRSLADKTVDFGATDVFLSDSEMTDMGAAVIHIPTSLGAVVLSYNLDIADLKLTAGIVSAIYRGKITKWNDERIKALNPDATLPDQAITPVYRSDGSGTTAVFSEYMSKVDTDWFNEIGDGKSLTFPVGIAAKGNPGVAGMINETKGAIGYIGSEYALAMDLSSARMQNRSGSFVEANIISITASAANIDIPADTRVVISNSPNADAYPITTFTWIIAYKEQHYGNRTLSEARALTNLFNYIIGNVGQEIATKTNYAPLPMDVRDKTVAIIHSMTFDGKALEEE